MAQFNRYQKMQVYSYGKPKVPPEYVKGELIESGNTEKKENISDSPFNYNTLSGGTITYETKDCGLTFEKTKEEYEISALLMNLIYDGNGGFGDFNILNIGTKVNNNDFSFNYLTNGRYYFYVTDENDDLYILNFENYATGKHQWKDIGFYKVDWVNKTLIKIREGAIQNVAKIPLCWDFNTLIHCYNSETMELWYPYIEDSSNIGVYLIDMETGQSRVGNTYKVDFGVTIQSGNEYGRVYFDIDSKKFYVTLLYDSNPKYRFYSFTLTDSNSIKKESTTEYIGSYDIYDVNKKQFYKWDNLFYFDTYSIPYNFIKSKRYNKFVNDFITTNTNWGKIYIGSRVHYVNIPTDNFFPVYLFSFNNSRVPRYPNVQSSYTNIPIVVIFYNNKTYVVPSTSPDSYIGDYPDLLSANINLIGVKEVDGKLRLLYGKWHNPYGIYQNEFYFVDIPDPIYNIEWV